MQSAPGEIDAHLAPPLRQSKGWLRGDKPRIQLVLPDLRGGGAERTTLNVRKEIRKRGHDIELILMNDVGEYLDAEEAQPWSLPPAGLFGRLAAMCKPDTPQRGLFQVPQLMGLIARRRPDVVMTSMADVSIPMGLALAALPARLRPRWIVREGNNSKLAFEEAIPEAGPRRFVEWLFSWAYRSADAVLVTSDGVASGLVEHYQVPIERIQIIGNPTEVSRVRELSRMDPTHPLPERFICAAGRLARQKGFDILLRAFAALENDEIELVICGDGPERGALEELARELGVSDRFHLTGFLDNPWAVMARAEVFCLPSRWEGFGHVVVEAMACDVPVVVFDCPYGPGETVRDGVDGWVVRNEDEAALCAALSDVFSNPAEAKERARRGRARADEFSSASIADAYERLYLTGRASKT